MPFFPFELIEEVLNHATSRPLASCALVSQDMLELSHSRLYRSMRMHGGTYAMRKCVIIMTATSHLLRYIRHLHIILSPGDVSSSGTQNGIQILQKLVSYGNLTAIWSAPGSHWDSPYLPHLISLLQLESVKYIQAPFFSPLLSDESCYQVRTKLLEVLFLSKAYLHLHYTLGHYTVLPPRYFPTLVSNQPIVTTLLLDLNNHGDPKDFQKSWEWFTSHVNLSHLRRLQISVDLDEQDCRFWSDLNNSLPESLSIEGLLGPSGALVSRFTIEKFDSLKNISFGSSYDSDEAIDLYSSNLIELVQRFSPSFVRVSKRLAFPSTAADIVPMTTGKLWRN